MAYKVEQAWTGVRMTIDRLRLFTIFSLLIALAVGLTWFGTVTLSGDQRTYYGRYVIASWRASQGVDDAVEFTIDGKKYKARATEWRDWMRSEIFDGEPALAYVLAPAIASGVAFVLAMIGFVRMGWRRPRHGGEEVLRGRPLNSIDELQEVVARGSAGAGRRDQKATPQPGLDIAGVRIPWGEVESHVIILGDTGSGKTSLIRHLLVQIRKRGEAAVIYDPEREFLPTFHEPGDTILNATDARMPAWAPGLEIDSVEDAEALATSLIPDPPDSQSRFWVEAARAVFVDILQRSDPNDPEAIAKACALPVEQLYGMLKGMPGAAALSPTAPQMAESVRGTLMVATRGLRVLPKFSDGREIFSIREWARKPRGFIFIGATEAHREATLPVVTTWLDALIRRLHDKPAGRKRVWVIADEVQTLRRLSSLEGLVTRGRKQGIAAVLGCQSVSQLKALYGIGATTIMSQPSTKVFYRCSEPELSKYVEDLIGTVERKTVRANLRADLTMAGRDYVSLNDDVRMTPLVLQTELAGLANFECYISFRGNVAKGRPRFTRTIVRVPHYIPRPNLPDLEPQEPHDAVASHASTCGHSESIHDHRRAHGVKHVAPPPSVAQHESDNDNPSPWKSLDGFGAHSDLGAAVEASRRPAKRLSGRASRSGNPPSRWEATPELPFDESPSLIAAAGDETPASESTADDDCRHDTDESREEQS